MTDLEIRQRLKQFAESIFSMDSSEAHSIKKELDSFIIDNDVTVEQMQEFAESGAGEELHMLTC